MGLIADYQRRSGATDIDEEELFARAGQGDEDALAALRRYWGYRTFGVSFGAVFCCVGAVVRVLKLGWPGFMGGQKVCLGSGFFVVVPRDKSV